MVKKTTSEEVLKAYGIGSPNPIWMFVRSIVVLTFMAAGAGLSIASGVLVYKLIVGIL